MLRKSKLFIILLIMSLIVSILPVGLPVYAVSDPDAYTFDISEGNITIQQGTSGIKVTYSAGLELDNIPAEQDITIIGGLSANSVIVNGITANITLDNVSLDASGQGAAAFELTNSANVNLTLKGTNTLKSDANKAGLQVPSGATLTITDASTGSFEATGGADGAGVGGGNGQASGTITIAGGTVIARSGAKSNVRNGAGIGGGSAGAGGAITISGGSVTAIGGHGAGIGGGYSQDSTSITISGGEVTAVGYWGYGIGPGNFYFHSGNAYSGTINIASSATVKAVSADTAIDTSELTTDSCMIMTNYSELVASGVIAEVYNNNKDLERSFTSSDDYKSIAFTVPTDGTYYLKTGGTYQEHSPDGIDPYSRNFDVVGTGLNLFNNVRDSLATLSDLTIDGTTVTGFDPATLTYDVELPAGTTTIPEVVATVADSGASAVVTDAASLPGATTILVTAEDGTTTKTYTINLIMPFDTSLGVIKVEAGSSSGLKVSKGGTVTVDNVDSGQEIIITGTSTNPVVVDGVDASITLDNVRIDTSGAGVAAMELTNGANVNLTLVGINELQSGGDYAAGLQVSDGNTIVIDGEGSLNAASGRFAAGIGSNGDWVNGVYVSSGAITILGGTVTANGGLCGTGIGGGYGAGGTINISGGTVIANGNSAAGIGGGDGGDGGAINISGGTVTANGDGGSAGIGGGATNGSGGIINISGGTVIANGNSGAGIGGADSGASGTINILGGTVTANGGYFGSGIGGGDREVGGTINILGGTVTANGGKYGSGIGGGNGGAGGSITIDEAATVITVSQVQEKAIHALEQDSSAAMLMANFYSPSFGKYPNTNTMVIDKNGGFEISFAPSTSYKSIAFTVPVGETYYLKTDGKGQQHGLVPSTDFGPVGTGLNIFNEVKDLLSPTPWEPTSVSAVAGDGQAEVSFTAPSSNGGTVITSYTVTSNPGGITSTGVSSPITVTGLTNGTTYTFTVVATNSEGDGIVSAASNEVTPAVGVTVPGAPTSVSAVAGDGQAEVSFTAPSSNGGTEITSYTVTSNPGGITATGASSPITVTGLTNGTTYTFTVVATNSEGDGIVSAASNEVTPTAAVTVPGAPTSISAVAFDGQAEISFTAPTDDGGTAITGYTVTSNPGSITAVRTGSPITVTGLTNGTTYTFTVVATNSEGDGTVSAVSNEVTPTADVTVPGAPTSVTAVAGDGQAEISFTAPVNDGGTAITGYTVTSNPGNITAVRTGSSITVTGLTNGTTYTFTVVATNSEGDGATSIASNEVTPTAPERNRRPRSSNSDPKPTETDATVIVNGQPQTAGTETVREENGRKQVNLKINTETAYSIIEAVMEDQADLSEEEKQNRDNILEVSVGTSDADDIIAALTGDVIEKMDENQFKLSVKTENVEYIIPAEEINVENIAESLDVAADSFEEIDIEVRINKLDEEVVREIEERAKENEVEIIFPPVEFQVVAKTTSKSGEQKEVEVSKFNQYAERVMEIPEGVDPSKITTGILYNPNGSFLHVPTEVFQKDGRYYAKINSLTNSKYSVIWNPTKVASVENHWSQIPVNDMASRLVITDPESFQPDAAITRGKFAEYMTNAVGVYLTEAEEKNHFIDIVPGDEMADAITIAADYNIIKGYSDGTFRPDAVISREEAMTMYARAMDIVKLKEIDNNRIENYQDKEQVAQWAYASVKKTLSAGVFNGRSEDTIVPKGTLTHAEAATAIRNLLIEGKLINN